MTTLTELQTLAADQIAAAYAEGHADGCSYAYYDGPCAACEDDEDGKGNAASDAPLSLHLTGDYEQDVEVIVLATNSMGDAIDGALDSIDEDLDSIDADLDALIDRLNGWAPWVDEKFLAAATVVLDHEDRIVALEQETELNWADSVVIEALLDRVAALECRAGLCSCPGQPV